MNLSGIPELKDWISRSRFDPRSFVLANVTVGQACALSLLFWPEFREYRGCVLLDLGFEEHTVDRWLLDLKGDVPAVEEVMNHVHLWDFLAPNSESEYRATSELAERMGAMWEAALKNVFPCRAFIVSVADDAESYGPTVTFYST